jgi:hypothetical protein
MPTIPWPAEPGLAIPRTTVPMLIGILLTMITGCDSPDSRLVDAARQASQQQAEQNRQIAQQSHQIAETTGQIVQAETQARQDQSDLQRQLAQSESQTRQELLALQQQLLDQDAKAREALTRFGQEVHTSSLEERKHLDQAQQALVHERENLLEAERRAPLVAAILSQLGLLVAGALPLAIVVYLISTLHSRPAQEDVLTELLVEEFVAETPRLWVEPAPHFLEGPPPESSAVVSPEPDIPWEASDDDLPF